MSGERVLVTGANGFTGSHLCRRLAEAGYAVRGLVRDASKGAVLRDYGVELVTGDLRDADTLKRAVTGTDIVYHLAAIYRQANVSRKEMWAVNVEGTRKLLDAAVFSGVRRFVHCSSIGVHGGITNGPATEETPYGPGDDYQHSKAEGERVALQYMAAGQLPVVVFRPAGIYGPRDFRFLKLFRAVKNRRFIMLGSGKITYHLVYVDDLVDGIVLCGTKENSVGHVYILADAAPVTLNDFVRVIAEAFGVRPPRLRFPVAPVYAAGFLCELLCKPLGINPPLYRRRVDFFRKNRAFDGSKAKRELGFEPKTDLKKGIRLTAEWYQKEGLL
jgi:nucleoside-diphosphate-sugar epimerase